jgi:nucleotide-binding universal stress UspA family protein
MALKDILVYVGNSKQCEARIDAAVGLASRHGAHIAGLYALSLPEIPSYIRAQIAEEALRHTAEAVVAAAERMENVFNEKCRLAGVNGEWRRVDGLPYPVLNLHGRYADVAIVGQRDIDQDEDPSDELPDHLILTLGRPVLVVPKVGQYPTIGERVLIAWDASRLAARAVNDAMPLLVKAKHVVVLAVNPESGDEGHGEIPSADICLHLARHGVHAEAQHIFAKDMSVGEMIAARTVDEGIDMIVTGAYGHARWRELVLGGVTRYLLNHMPVPVLMSH